MWNDSIMFILQMERISKRILCDRRKKRRAEARQAEEVCPYVTLFELKHEQDVTGHRELRIVVAGKHE